MRIAAAALLALTVAACASPVAFDAYPWVTGSDNCKWTGEITNFDRHSGYLRPFAPEAEAGGRIQATDGRPILKTDYIELSFGNSWGAQTILGASEQFTFCVSTDTVRAKGGSHAFTATLRAAREGPILYRTPKPQRFDPSKPIVVLIEPVKP